MSGLSAPEAAVRVPACPDWTVRDLLSHIVGLGADVLAGDEPDDHNPGWTARQVERRRGRNVGELVGEWQELAAPLREWMARNGSARQSAACRVEAGISFPASSQPPA